MATKINKPAKKTTKGAPPPAEAAPVAKKSNNLTKRPSDQMVALNFSVPAEFRTRFKMFAVMHDMKQVEVLFAAFEEFEKSRTE
jgi:hypothetical protein